jgi:tight adherence protein C
MLPASTFLIVGSVLLIGAAAISAFSVAAILGERRRRAPATVIAPDPAPRAAIEDDLLKRFARFVTPVKETELSQVRLRLARAGFRLPSAVRVFHAARAVSALAFTLITAVLVPILFATAPGPLQIVAILFAFLIGFLAPSIVLDRLVARRQKTAEEGFPDTLDMLLVCIEAGQGFEQAARRIARELRGHNPVLAEELSILNDELWAGKDRAQVFKDFALRLDVGDITAFTSVLRQADQFGVSIAEAIRVYAADMRFKRVMRAEETANKMPLKLALASMMFTVPPTMIIMIGPALLEIIRSFTQAQSGGL